MNTRTLLDGQQVADHEQPIHLHVVTRCPGKWVLVDMETGEEWMPTERPPYQWRRIVPGSQVQVRRR